MILREWLEHKFLQLGRCVTLTSIFLPTFHEQRKVLLHVQLSVHFYVLGNNEIGVFWTKTQPLPSLEKKEEALGAIFRLMHYVTFSPRLNNFKH